MKKRIFQYVWGVAEQMDWDRRFPRMFWAWLLRWCDRRAGYTATGALGDILLKARAEGGGVDGAAPQ